MLGHVSSFSQKLGQVTSYYDS